MVVSVRVKGGIGNQLFQYSAALAVARKFSWPVILESEIPARTQLLSSQIRRRSNARTFLLSRLGLPIKRIGRSTWALCSEGRAGEAGCHRGLRRNHFYLVRGGGRTTVDDSENWDTVLEQIERSRGNVVLDGYWHQRAIVESVFPTLAAQSRSFLTSGFQREKKSNFQSLMVHVRRGDYVWAGARQSKGLLGVEYFREAIEFAKERLDFDTVRVFSEDVAWCEKAFSDFESLEVMRPNTKNPHLDLARMAHGKGLVISNSTFSWWAALLSKDSNQIIIAPEPWALTNRYNADYSVPGWNYLESTFDS